MRTLADAARQENDMAETKTHITEVRTINVPVNDQERALDFYVGKLGFEKRLDMSYGQGQRWIEVAPAGAATTVALAPPGGGPVGIDTGIRFATADAEADHTDLQARGVDVDAEIMRWPGVPPMFALRDPDGNTLRIVELAA
jgi:predicted enzyme related to lactoylglutathione lyase